MTFSRAKKIRAQFLASGAPEFVAIGEILTDDMLEWLTNAVNTALKKMLVKKLRKGSKQLTKLKKDSAFAIKMAKKIDPQWKPNPSYRLVDNAIAIYARRIAADKQAED